MLFQVSRLGRFTGRCVLLTDPPKESLEAEAAAASQDQRGEEGAVSRESSEATRAECEVGSDFKRRLLLGLPGGVDVQECDAYETKRLIEESVLFATQALASPFYLHPANMPFSFALAASRCLRRFRGFHSFTDSLQRFASDSRRFTHVVSVQPVPKAWREADARKFFGEFLGFEVVRLLQRPVLQSSETASSELSVVL